MDYAEIRKALDDLKPKIEALQAKADELWDGIEEMNRLLGAIEFEIKLKQGDLS
jgi:peptidoglycan hydrolase CwlO-like protein